MLELGLRVQKIQRINFYKCTRANICLAIFICINIEFLYYLCKYIYHQKSSNETNHHSTHNTLCDYCRKCATNIKPTIPYNRYSLRDGFIANDITLCPFQQDYFGYVWTFSWQNVLRFNGRTAKQYTAKYTRQPTI